MAARLGLERAGLARPVLGPINLGIPACARHSCPRWKQPGPPGRVGWGVYDQVVWRGVGVVGSYWTGATLFWLAVSFVLRFQNWGDFLSVILSRSLFLLPVVILMLLWWGWAGLGLAGTVWFAVVVYNMLPLVPARSPAARPRFGRVAEYVAIRLNPAKPLPPNYSRAVAKMKFGKFSEAEWEVINELEKCEDDVDGWMMLAELYATHFHDLPTAEETIRDLCQQPNVTPSQVAVALHRLADWHLKEGVDPVAARRALEEICQRFAGSHLDKMARLRIQSLPATREEFLEQRQAKPFRLPAARADSRDLFAGEPAKIDLEEARSQAAAWVERLKANPNDAPARAAFAALLAEQLGQPDLAMEQMRLLLGMGKPSPSDAIGWLARMAQWQLRYKQDSGAAQELLEELIHQYPQAPQAFEAQARLSALRVEDRLRRARAKLSQAVPPERL